MRGRFPKILPIGTLQLAAILCLLPGCGRAETFRAAALDVPFALHGGETAAIGPTLRVSVEAIDATGECPGGHQECVEVSPPGAHLVAAAGDGRTARLDYWLLGRPSARHFADWDIEVTRSEPWPFTERDVADGRVAVVIRVTKPAPSPEVPDGKRVPPSQVPNRSGLTAADRNTDRARALP